MIEVINLVKKYKGQIAVDHLSFSVEKGQIYGFLGPNGAGKSTTMNIMTGYIAPTEGSVKIGGYDITKDAEKAKKMIGYLPEFPPLYQDMTVEEYLKFTAHLKKINKNEVNSQIKEVYKMVGIEDVAEKLIGNLSKGFKQRVGLAQAIMGFPEIIILDEPMVGLDPKQIIEIRDLIKHLGENHTIILSSHILSEISAVCDHIMIISKGCLVASEKTSQLMNMMNGITQLQITVKGDEKALRDVISKVNCDKYCIISTDEAQCSAALIDLKRDNDIREELFYHLVDAKLPLMSMHKMEQSLEDIFLALTANETDDEGQSLTTKDFNPESEGQSFTTKDLNTESKGQGDNNESNL